MQPIFFSFASGLHYRKTVKLHFRRISTFYLMVSIYENSSFRRFLSFLTAGNKSKCGTLQRLTDPQQSTDEPIFRPVSSQNRQVSQRKPFVLSPISAQTSSRLRIHGTSVPSTLHTRAPTCPSHPKVACNSRTRVTQQHELIRTCNTLKGNCMRNCGTPCRPLSKSHVIPPGPHSSTAQKQRNINDPISNSETSSRELRAKLLSFTRFLGSHARRPPRGLRGNRGVAAALVGGGRVRARRRTPDWRPPRGLGALAGLRDDAPGHTSATQRRRCGGRRRDRRARAGFEIDHSERSSRVAISRAAGPDGARNTSGATSTARDLAGQQQRRKSGGPQQAAPRPAAAQ